MTHRKSTITVNIMDDKPVIIMDWDKLVQHGDVERAYQTIQMILDAADEPHHIIVDLISNPAMPMTETLMGALRGPYAHPMVKQWLIAGQHHVGQIVARLLAQSARKSHVVWFQSMAEVEAYLDDINDDDITQIPLESQSKIS